MPRNLPCPPLWGKGPKAQRGGGSNPTRAVYGCCSAAHRGERSSAPRPRRCWWGTPRGTRAMAGRRWRPSRRDCTSAPARRPRVRARRGCRRAAKGRKRTDQAAPWVECGAGAHVNGPERTTHLHRRGGGVHNPPAAPSGARRCTLYMEADTLCPKAAHSLSNRPDNTPTRFTTRTIHISQRITHTKVLLAHGASLFLNCACVCRPKKPSGLPALAATMANHSESQVPCGHRVTRTRRLPADAPDPPRGGLGRWHLVPHRLSSANNLAISPSTTGTSCG